jgi:hypothetical protein
MNLKGDYVVAGMVTGTHVIEDIKVPVPHQVAVRIPADLAHRSKDLWRGLQQNRLFLLKGGFSVSGAPEHLSVEPPDVAVLGPDLVEENRRLVQELDSAKKENEALRKTLQAQEGKLEAILVAVGRLGEGQAVVASTGVKASSEATSGAVGGEVPMYIPSDGLKPKGAETNIQVVENTSKGTSVTDAAQKLKELRRKSAD